MKKIVVVSVVAGHMLHQQKLSYKKIQPLDRRSSLCYNLKRKHT